jgi:hypothetical protein
VVNQARPIARRSRLPKHKTDARRARIHNPVHPLRAAIETLVRAPAHLRLPVRIAVQPRDDDIRYLLDELLKIAVL